MTLKEIGKGLGDEWELHGTHWTRPYRNGLLTVRPFSGQRPWVVLYGDHRPVPVIHWPCPSAETAVAVAHLLVTIERIST